MIVNIISKLSMIVLSGTFVYSDWRFDNLCDLWGRYNSPWLWRWPRHRSSKRQSLSSTVLFRTTFTRKILLNLLMEWLLNWNLSQIVIIVIVVIIVDIINFCQRTLIFCYLFTNKEQHLMNLCFIFFFLRDINKTQPATTTQPPTTTEPSTTTQPPSTTQLPTTRTQTTTAKKSNHPFVPLSMIQTCKIHVCTASLSMGRR